MLKPTKITKQPLAKDWGYPTVATIHPRSVISADGLGVIELQTVEGFPCANQVLGDWVRPRSVELGTWLMENLNS